jgi:Tol biopolymer transport system component
MVSPDGKYIGYDLPVSDTRAQRDVFIISVDGAREVNAVSGPSNDLMMCWSADGKWLLFASDRTGSTGLWGLGIADGKPNGAPQLLRSDLPLRA